MESTNNPGYWINLDTRKQDTTQSGFYFSETNSQKPYGLGFESGIPVDLQKKNMYLTVSGRFRMTDATQSIQLVTDIKHNDSLVIYKSVNIGAKGKINEWVAIHDSLLIPANIPTDSKMKIYFWNQDGKADADFTDLDIHLSFFKNPSYLIH